MKALIVYSHKFFDLFFEVFEILLQLKEKHLPILKAVTGNEDRPFSDFLNPFFTKGIEGRIIGHDELWHIVPDTGCVEFFRFVQNHIQKIAVLIEVNHALGAACIPT